MRFFDERIKFKDGVQEKMFLNMKKDLSVSQEILAKMLNVSRSYLRLWIKEERFLPLQIFNKIMALYPKSRIFKNEIIEFLPYQWWSTKGGKKRIEISKSEGSFKSMINELHKARRKNSTMEKINVPPLSKYTKEIIKQKISTIPILASLLITDGSLNYKKNQISFTSTDFTLINIFTDLIKLNSKIVPYLSKRRNGIFESYVFDAELCKKLLLLSPSYKKSPYKNQSKEDYLKESQPTIEFLFNQNEEVKRKCIQTAMSCDGFITTSYDKGKNIRNTIGLSCSHPCLIYEWKNLLESFKIDMHIVKNERYWAGYGCLLSSSSKVIKNFSSIGFIPEVKITGKSKRFKGIEKNKMLELALCNNKFKSWKEIYSWVQKPTGLIN
ncbi:hypothetical protein A3K64_04365 [Candidatus Micrarchaeota archaeon RBG_16_36_9]|nr:MAG: hypothetical protein A3K64_04365 [Candidatus Micrarchaeota archaeon RBG_16_36_9]